MLDALKKEKVKDKMLGVLVTSDFHNEITSFCKKHDIKMSTLLRIAIEKEFNLVKNEL